MTYDYHNGLTFHQVSDDRFIRKCYGLEELVSNMEEYCDGFAHLTVSASVTLPSVPTSEILQIKVKQAWTAFRHFLPAIACKSFRETVGDKRFAFRYIVPHSEQDLQEWLDATVYFVEKGNRKTLYEKHCELKDNRWWRCSDDRYVLELHVEPMGSGWIFNGVNCFALLDIFLKFLVRQLDEETISPLNLEWGREVARLPPPGAVIANLTRTRRESPPDKPDRGSSSTMSSEEIPKEIPWLYATHTTGQTGDVTRLVHFSEDVTKELHKLCREKGRTITQAITALTALAHAEAALNIAGKAGERRFDEVLGSYKASSHYIIPWNFINQRKKLPDGYDSYESPRSTALCTADCIPLSFPMDGLRSCIKVDENKRSVLRVTDEVAFWDVIVRDVADAWKRTDVGLACLGTSFQKAILTSGLKQSLAAYETREGVLHRAFDAFTPEIFSLPALIVSSIGDLDRLCLLSSFIPSNDDEPGPPVVVHDVVCGIRLRTPPIMNLFWEYRGKIACHFMSGGEYTTSDDMDLVVQTFKEWVQVVVR